MDIRLDLCRKLISETCQMWADQKPETPKQVDFNGKNPHRFGSSFFWIQQISTNKDSNSQVFVWANTNTETHPNPMQYHL